MGQTFFMIGKLTGFLDNINGNTLLIDVQGVGYVVTCSVQTVRRLGALGERVSLRVETIVREDAISLYGFDTADEQAWFRLLTTVQGVGARVALGILGRLPPPDLVRALCRQDKTELSRADGVGAKLAARLVTELKSKAENFAGTSSQGQGAQTDHNDSNAGVPTMPFHSAQDALLTDAVAALMGLGYKRLEALERATVARKTLGDNAVLADVIRASLTHAPVGSL